MRKSGLALAILVLVVLLPIACSRDRIQPPGGGDVDVGQLAEEMNEQLHYHQTLAALAAAMDTTAAMDSVAALLAADPDVDWAINAGTQVNIRWKSGMPGFLLLRAGGRRTDAPILPAPGRPEQGPGAAIEATPSGPYTLPKHRKSLYLAPCYQEFKFWDNDLIETADSVLPAAGFEPFTVVKESDVTLARFLSLAQGQYGIIRLSTHGAAYPDTNNIEEVFYLSGEVVTDASRAANADALANGLLGVTTYYDENRYSFCSPFLRDKLDFGDSKPIVLLGLCFGYLGSWAEDLRMRANAGAVMGWDWEVDARVDSGKMSYLFTDLCDTTLAKPWTLQGYYRSIRPYYMEGSRQITLHYSAADSFAFWSPDELTITGIDPARGAAGEYVFIQGEKLGTTAGTVRFGSTPSTTFGYWTDSVISVQVPEGGQAGTVPVTVSVGGKTSNALDFFYQDELFQRLHGSSYMIFFLEAWHRFDPWDSGSPTIFAQNLQPVIWEGQYFFGERKEATDSSSNRLVLYGSVGRDGRTLSVEYEFADTTLTQDARFETYKKARIVGLPFDDFYGATVHYDVENGPSVQGHVEELVWRRRVYDLGGGVTGGGDYTGTDWEVLPENNRLQVVFQ